MSSTLLSCAVNAACEASKDSDRWSVEDWHDGDRSEHWITSYVGIRINDQIRGRSKNPDNPDQSVLVAFEPRVSWLTEYFSKKRKKVERKFTGATRFDIAVWSKTRGIEGLVEVKNAPRANPCHFANDVARLDNALRLWGREDDEPLKWGLFLFSVVRRKNGSQNDFEKLVSDRIDLCQERTKLPYEHLWQPVAETDACRLAWCGFMLRRDAR